MITTSVTTPQGILLLYDGDGEENSVEDSGKILLDAPVVVLRVGGVGYEINLADFERWVKPFVGQQICNQLMV